MCMAVLQGTLRLHAKIVDLVKEKADHGTGLQVALRENVPTVERGTH